MKSSETKPLRKGWQMHNFSVCCCFFFWLKTPIYFRCRRFFWSTDFDNWTSNEKKVNVFVFIMLCKWNYGLNLPAIKPLWNTLQIYKMYHLELSFSVVIRIDHWLFYMSYLYYILLSMGTTLSTHFKQNNHAKRLHSRNIQRDPSVYSGSLYMMSRDLIYYVMTSSDGRRDTLVLSGAYVSKTCSSAIINQQKTNRFPGI